MKLNLHESKKKEFSVYFFVSYLCPWAAVPYGCCHTGTPIAGLHLCWFIPNALPGSCTLSDPSSSQTHHLSPLHSRATLCRTLREMKWRVLLSTVNACLFTPVLGVLLTVLDQSVKYQLVTHGPMLHSSVPCGRALELHSFSFTALPSSLTQRTLLVLLPTPQSTEHCNRQRGEKKDEKKQ